MKIPKDNLIYIHKSGDSDIADQLAMVGIRGKNKAVQERIAEALAEQAPFCHVIVNADNDVRNIALDVARLLDIDFTFLSNATLEDMRNKLVCIVTGYDDEALKAYAKLLGCYPLKLYVLAFVKRGLRVR